MRRFFSKKRLLVHVLICLGFLAFFWGFYAPPRRWPGLTYFGYGQDPLAFIWFLNWFVFAWGQHLPLLFTRMVDAPVGTALVWKTCVPALAVLAAPFTRQFGAVAVFNVLMIAAPALAGFGVYLAAFELVGGIGPALAAGALFGISGYEIGQGQGHLNLAFTVAVPLCVFVCLRAARRGWPAWLLGVVLGALLAFEFGVSQEVFASLVLFGGMALGSVVVLHAPARGGILRLLPGIGLGLALSAVVISPFVWQMLLGYGPAQQNLSRPDLYGNDLLGFVLPTPLSVLGGQALVPVTGHFAGNTTEQGGYFSLPLLVLLGWIVWRGGGLARAIGLVLLLAMVFSLGPHLRVDGVRVSSAPWTLVSKWPLLRGILPCRLALYGWVAAAMLVAVWLAERPSWRRYVWALACLGVLAPAQSFCRNWTHLPVPAVFAALPAGANVLVIPVFGQEMGWQYAAGMRFNLVGQGYLGTGRPAPFDQWKLFEPLWENAFGAVKPAELAAYLRAYGVEQVVVLAHGYGFFRPGVDDGAAGLAAEKLFAAAGWRVVKRMGDGEVFVGR